MINNQEYTSVDGDPLRVGMKVRYKSNNTTGEVEEFSWPEGDKNSGYIREIFKDVNDNVYALVSQTPTEGGMGWIRVDLEKLEAHSGSQSGGGFLRNKSKKSKKKKKKSKRKKSKRKKSKRKKNK